MAGKRKYNQKYFFKEPLKNMSKKDIIEYLNMNVFNKESFLLHIQEVSHNLKIDEEIVKDVVKSYIIGISLFMNKQLKIKTKINIYGFFSFVIKKGKRF